MENSLVDNSDRKEVASSVKILSHASNTCDRLDSGYSSPATFLQSSTVPETKFSFENISLATFNNLDRSEDDGTASSQDVAEARRTAAIQARKAKPRSISLCIPNSSGNLCSGPQNRESVYPRTHWYDASCRRHSYGNLQPTVTEFLIINERLLPNWRPFKEENSGKIFTLSEADGDEEDSTATAAFRSRSSSSPPILAVIKCGKTLRDMGDDLSDIANRRRNSFAQGQGDVLSLPQRTLGLARRAYSSLTSLPSALRRSSLPAMTSESAAISSRRRVYSEAYAQFLEIDEDRALVMTTPSPSSALAGGSGVVAQA